MSSFRPSRLDRVVGGSFSVLVAVIAMFVAVHLLREIWPWLLGGLVTISLGLLVIRWLRGRHTGGW